MKRILLKIKLSIILLWTTIAISGQSFAVLADNNAPSAPIISTVAPSVASDILANVLATPCATSCGPEDQLQDYEAGMVSVTRQFSAKIAIIAGAVERGELSREQGEEISAEQYETAQMQFNLLSALHEMLAQDFARENAAPQSPSKPSQENEIVMVALPFSSLQLNPSVIESLDLSPYQVRSIQQVMSDERSTLEPLMAQLQTTREQLLNITERDQTKNEKEVKALAAAQARNLTKLIVANSRMRARIYQLLSPQQQRKLDEIQKSSETLVADN